LNVEQIFQSLQKGKISPSKAEKLLSLYSIEKIGNIAQIDTGRKNRKGIPEIILGERKQLLDPVSGPPNMCKDCSLLGEPGW